MSQAGRIRELFDRAVHLTPALRAELLSQACDSDPLLRAEVERLLAGHDRFGDVFDAEDPVGVVDEPPVPEIIGAYRVVREIGRGGAGAVYLAVRDDAAYVKTVAIKVLQPAARTLEMVRRFRHERQILALIEHPYVAKLLDGGTTPAGAPYLIMEYVEGLPIDEYCDTHRLSTTARLELFGKVCDAVRFAHQHLVVHRDIKPANILVTADGSPKLLDFGIAKLLAPESLSLTAEVTLAEARLMTPEYASPEQVRGEAITTATDVYALGVLLYKILTGRLPYHHGGTLADLARAICDEEPRRPSTIQTSDRKRLQGDLDNIVLRAIRKEAHRRYASVEQLADDIQRHLAHLPVRARSDTLAYRVTKFVRRHRTSAALAAMLVLLLTAAVFSLSLQAMTIARERDRAEALRARAEREAATASAINRFLQETLGAANPQTGLGREVSLSSALASAATSARQAFASEPLIEAGLLNVVGRTFVELGRYKDAGPLLDRALQLRRTALGGNHPAVADSLEGKATLLRWEGRYGEAERLYREALAVLRDSAPERQGPTVEAMHGLALTLAQRGDDQPALAILQEALDVVRTQGLGDRVRAELLSSQGVSYRRLGQHAQAEAAYREALAIQRRLLAPTHPEIGTILNNLGVVLTSSERYAEAEPVVREALAVRQTALGPGHPLVANSLLNLAVILERQGAVTEAEGLYRDAAAVVRAALGADHPRLAQVLRNHGVLLLNRDRPDDAVPLLREALRIRRQTFVPANGDVADALLALSSALRQQGSLVEAERLGREALALAAGVPGTASEPMARARQQLGTTLCVARPTGEALELLRDAAAFYATTAAQAPRDAAGARGAYGECLAKARRFEEAETELTASRDLLGDEDPNGRQLRQADRRLDDLYRRWGKTLTSR